MVAEELVEQRPPILPQRNAVDVRSWSDSTAVHFTVTDAGSRMTARQFGAIAAVQRLEGHVRAQQDLGSGSDPRSPARRA